MVKTLLVTGSSGLIGSAVCTHFAARGWRIHGVDNNSRAYFFGPQATRDGTSVGSSRRFRTFSITSWMSAIGMG